MCGSRASLVRLRHLVVNPAISPGESILEADGRLARRLLPAALVGTLWTVNLMMPNDMHRRAEILAEGGGHIRLLKSFPQP